MSDVAKTAVGMEINQSEVIAVKLRQGRKGPVVTGYAREPLAAGAVTTNRVAEPEDLRRAARAALKRAKADAANVCVSIASETMDARVVHYPALPERELLANIQWDLQQLFGAAADGSTERLVAAERLPHQPLAETGATEAQHLHPYLAVSAPKRAVYEFLEPLHAARIFPEIVDVGAFSLPWAVPRGGGVGYLQLGPALTHFVMIESGTFAVQRQASMVIGPRQQVGTMMDLLRWIDETLEFVRVQSGAFAVEDCMQTLIVSGAAATTPGLITLIQDRTGLETIAAVPTGLAAGGTAIPADDAPAFALAVALAQRGLNEL